MRWSSALARIIRATSAVDRAYHAFTAGRSAAVAAYAPDSVLDRLNELGYRGDRTYDPAAADFRTRLFPWEEAVIERFFPPPPARVLVGAAGGGREAFALAGRGYRLVAFEPIAALAATIISAKPSDSDVAAYRAAYEELPTLEPVDRGVPVRLDELGEFDAAIFGWASFSHLRRREHRIEALRWFGRVTRGPIVVSSLGKRLDRPPEGPVGWKRHLPPRRPGRERGDRFTLGTGFYHPLAESELLELARASGLRVVYVNFDTRDTNWPHAVLEAEAA